MSFNTQGLVSTRHSAVSGETGEGPPRGAPPPPEWGDTRGMRTGHKLNVDGSGCFRGRGE